MSNRLPLEINPIRLIEGRQILEGSLAVASLPRLSKVLFSLNDTSTDERVLDVKLNFGLTESRKRLISGHITGILDLECQRCLGAVEYKLDNHFAVILVKSDAEAEQLQEGDETWLLEEERLFLPDFIEDEVLLSLPFITAHDACETVIPMIEALPEDEILAQQDDEANNPFAVLQQLKK